MATQFATASYQEIIDLNTESDSVSAIGIHTPSSSTPVDFLQGFWKQFQKFRYDGCSVTLVPAARLPVDPLGVSYDAGESQIDPRDLLNPILFHGCHGQDMGLILNQLYNGTVATHTGTVSKVDYASNQLLGASDSMEHVACPNLDKVSKDHLYPVEALYYKALTDNTWKKADPSRGFKKSGLRPLVHDVAVSAPFGVAKHYAKRGLSDDFPIHMDGSNSESVVSSSDAGFAPSSIGSLPYDLNLANGYPIHMTGSDGSSSGIYPSPVGIQFLTNRVRALGWLDTQSPFARQATGTNESDCIQSGANDLGKLIAGDQVTSHLIQNTVPKIYMGMFLLPPAYKTKQYYRMIINHRFSFAKFRGISMMNYTTNEVDSAYGYYNTMRNV